MSQTAPDKQCFMTQTHKTHTGQEWELKRHNREGRPLDTHSFHKLKLLERFFSYCCMILPFIYPEGVVLHHAKLYFSTSASRGPWALLSHWPSVLQSILRWHYFSESYCILPSNIILYFSVLLQFAHKWSQHMPFLEQLCVYMFSRPEPLPRLQM